MGAIGKFSESKFGSELSKLNTASELWIGVEDLHKAKTAESTGLHSYSLDLEGQQGNQQDSSATQMGLSESLNQFLS